MGKDKITLVLQDLLFLLLRNLIKSPEERNKVLDEIIHRSWEQRHNNMVEIGSESKEK